MSDKQLGEIIDGVFLHGKETPDQSYDLPQGQYTVAEAVEKIESFISTERQRAFDEVREYLEKKTYSWISKDGETDLLSALEELETK